MHVHVALAPGERLRAGTRERLDRLFASDPDVGAALLPLVPEGDGWFPRTARRYAAAWDARFLHRQNWFVPLARVASRAPLPGHRAADAAPHLADLIQSGRARVEVLPEGGVDTGLARDLESWTRWASEEGLAWGRLAARDARFPPFLPALSWGGWTRHNVVQSGRRLVEVLQARRSPDAGAWLLHATREAAWTAGCVRGFRHGSRGPPGP